MRKEGGNKEGDGSGRSESRLDSGRLFAGRILVEGDLNSGQGTGQLFALRAKALRICGRVRVKGSENSERATRAAICPSGQRRCGFVAGG